MRGTIRQTNLRIPQELYDAVQSAAKKAGHSMNAEFLARVRASFSDGEVLTSASVATDRKTLRDEFACIAMQASWTACLTHVGHTNHRPVQDIAEEAYSMADAMLIAREATS